MAPVGQESGEGAAEAARRFLDDLRKNGLLNDDGTGLYDKLLVAERELAKAVLDYSYHKGLILALTASPGSHRQKIEEIKRGRFNIIIK